MESQRIAEIVAQARSNQAGGYEQLLLAYGKRLYCYFFHATGSHHDSEDLLGELMLRLVRVLEQYQDQGRFEPWLFRIAGNMVRDRVRRNQASPLRGAQAPDGLEHEPPASTPPVEQALLTAETSVSLRAALEKLDPTTREMILLRHYADMSFREIAETFGCPLGTALARVHRGLRALRKYLGDEYDQ